MSDKYDILLQKYNLSVAQTKDLKEQLTLKKEQWQTRENEFNISTKLIRELCESILAKSPEQNKLGKSGSWDSLELNEMIHLSMKVLKEYNEERKDLMNKISDELEERGVRIRELEDNILFLKNHRGKSIDEATEEDLGEDEDFDQYQQKKEKEKENKEKKEKVKRKMSPKLQDKIDNGEVDIEVAKEIKKDIQEGVATVEFEDEDEIVEGDKSDELHKDMITNNITAKVTPKSIRSFHSPKEAKRRKEMRKEVEDELYSTKYKDIIAKMSDMHWDILRIMGTTGHSRSNEIVKILIDEYMDKGQIISNSQAFGKLPDMEKIGLLVRQEVKTPFSIIKVAFLTAEGAYLFKKHFENEQYHLAEYDRLIKEHTTLEHGYGIMMCAEKIQEIKIDKKKIYARVDIWNRKKAISVGGADGQSNIKYIPDIVCIDTMNNKTYIEYELNHHIDTELYNKCNKMVQVGIDKINFIVPNKSTAQSMCERLIKWVATRKGSEITRRMVIRVTTAKSLEGHDLRQDSEWMFVYKPMQDKEFKSNF